MNRTTSMLISVIMHPVFVNLLSLVALLNLLPYLKAGLSEDAKWFYVLYVFITTSLIPLMAVVGMKLFGKAGSVMLENKEERRFPYVLTASLYLFGYYLFQRINAPQVIQAYMLANASILVAVLIINHFTKISIHATSLGALTGLIASIAPYMLADARIFITLALIVSGLTATARLYLDAHKPFQLYTGFALGVFLMMILL